MMLEKEFILRDNVLVVRLKGEIDHHEATILRNEWQRYLHDENLKHVILNMDAVTFMDSSGIGVILGRYKEVMTKGGEFVVCGVHGYIDRLFSMSGLVKVVRIEENEEDALLSLGVAS
ncbi:MAG: anti-sigma F factor antagonist [Bacilli bacterium]|nr:anti-sigma F factor antagonist [Bacilli bacterium]